MPRLRAGSKTGKMKGLISQVQGIFTDYWRFLDTVRYLIQAVTKTHPLSLWPKVMKRLGFQRILCRDTILGYLKL